MTGGQVTKYYFAGASRIAMRKYTVPSSMTVEYLLGDHLGSTSITTDNTGAKVSEMRYKPWGEVRYSWTSAASTTPDYSLADYTFTGQYSYMDDPSTSGVTEGFGLMFYNARWYDPYLARFAQADSIVPAGVQGYDRYAYVNNNPIIYTDPDGHNPILILLAAAFLLTACASPNTQDTQTVLDSTVGLRLVTTDGQVNYDSDSLGTYLGNGQIYTHDHFEEILSMELYNAEGELVYSTSDFDRTVIDPKHGSIITVGDNLDGLFNAAELLEGESVNLHSGMDVISPIWKERAENGLAIPGSGITTISGNITPDNDFDDPNGHYGGIKWSAQTTAGDSGGGFWVFKDGKMNLVGNLRQGASTSTSSIHRIE